jgi:hypothetical protein
MLNQTHNNQKQPVPSHIQSWLLTLAGATPPAESSHAAEAMVGCYSEAFFACSYNDEDLFSLLLSGDMNSEAARHGPHARKDEPWYDGDWFFHQMQGHRIDAMNGDYAGQLMAAVSAAGGWPADYCSGQRLSTLEYFEHHYPSTCEHYDLSFLKVEPQESASRAVGQAEQVAA